MVEQALRKYGARLLKAVKYLQDLKPSVSRSITCVAYVLCTTWSFNRAASTRLGRPSKIA
jgi:hypothetical protein